MKSRFIISTILLFVGISTYAQVDDSGNQIRSNEKTQKLNNTKASRADFYIEFDSIRALTEINLPDNSEAYPWISDDGLRLYFTLQTDSIDLIVLSTRTSVNDAFSTPQKMSINSSINDNSSPWLTSDELDLFFIVRETTDLLTTTLYHAKRASIEEEFETPTKVNVIGNLSGALWSPSFTKDLEKLYVLNWGVDVQNILIFERLDIDEYYLKDSLAVPATYEVGPGKLGQNDLKYYLSLTENDKKSLYVYEREKVADIFDTFSYLNNTMINNSLYRNHSPSISNNGHYFVFTRSVENRWTSNDLYIAYNSNLTTSVSSNEIDRKKPVKVYPNPTSESLMIELQDGFKNTKQMLSIYSMEGVLVESKITTHGTEKIRLSTTHYKSGVYLFDIQNAKGQLTKGKFIVHQK